MVFSSLVFLFLFLPAVLMLHQLLPKKVKNTVLLIFNLVFYGYGEPIYILLMAASIVCNFVLGRIIFGLKRQQYKKLVLIISVIFNLALLGWFKYAGLFAQTLRACSVFSFIPEISVVLPIGISFYTFQAMSYVVDVYRGDCKASRNIIDFAAYISLFPQLIAGPIVRYCDVEQQLRERSVSAEKFSWGVKVFCIGLAKKVLLANQFALLWDFASAQAQHYGAIVAWVGIIAFALQIYFDFSGYSDMARGLGAMFGFDFCINFNYPYISNSITDFWRRWHISLSTWFRDYVYIPLGGSRKGTIRTICNLMIVWMLTGFWHGAGWNFLLWGIYYGILLVIEKFLFAKVLNKLPKWLQWTYTMVLVLLGWVFFASVDISAAWTYLASMFHRPAWDHSARQLLCWLPLLFAGVLCAMPLGMQMWKRFASTRCAVWVEAAICIAILCLCTASLVSGSYNPFLYFRF